ncbi:hemolysin family protein [soil metagenome]
MGAATSERTMTGWSLLVAVALLVANAFFVAAEFALITARRTKIEPLADAGNRRARVAMRQVKELSLQLAGAQLGITMASLGLGFVAEPAVADVLERAVETFVTLPTGLLHTLSFVVALSIVVFLHMVLGEMVPKNIAIAGPERTLLWLAVPNQAYMTVFRPVIRALNAIANGGVRLLRVEPRDELATVHTAQELSAMVAMARHEGLIEEFEHKLLTGALDFGDRDVASVMIPRDEVVAVRRTCTVAEAERVVVQRGHSRLPVLGEGLDDVRGFLHAKDLLSLPPEAQDRPIPVDRLRPMLIVSQQRSLEELLLTMQRAHLHFALVTDGQGHTTGIVTLEDILEELVGEIRDESDAEAGLVGPPR